MIYHSNSFESRILLEGFGTQILGESCRSLGLLNQIESTIASLSRLKRRMEIDSEEASELRQQIISLPITAESVIEESSLTNLERAEDALALIYELFCTKRDSALKDRRLKNDDGVADAYEDVLEACQHLHNELEELRWTVMEHNSDAEPAREPIVCTNPADIDRLID